ncbi:MAG: hypothetical protein AAGF33_17185 [Pseudomonadota bacterium]
MTLTNRTQVGPPLTQRTPTAVARRVPAAADAVPGLGEGGAEVVRPGDPVIRVITCFFLPLNIQSLLPKIQFLHHELTDAGVDIASIAETGLKPRVPNRMITIPGFQLVRKDRSDGRGYGGVAFLVRGGFDVDKIPSPPAINTASRLETLWIRVSTGHNRSVVLCAAYRPPFNTTSQLTADFGHLEVQILQMLTCH